MSLILDALNKADKEKHEPDASPGLDTEHELPEDFEEPKSSKAKTALVATALCAIVFVLIWSVFFQSKDSRQPPSNATLSSETTSKLDTPNADITVQHSQQTSNTNQRKQELQKRVIEAQYKKQQLEQERQQVIASETTPIANNSGVSKPEDSRISGLYSNTPNNKKASSSTDRQTIPDNKSINTAETTRSGPSDAEIERLRLEALNNNTNKEITDIVNEEIIAINKERMQRRAEANAAASATLTPPPTAPTKNDQIKVASNVPTTGNSEPDTPRQNDPTGSSGDDTKLAFYEDIGSVRDLPLSTQSKIPTLMYTQHNYSSRAKSIEINGKQYRENSRISGDLRVHKILEDGVILRYEKYTFKMSAFNNYLNF